LWDHIARRLCSLGGPGVATQCDEALADLLREEAAVEARAITGGEGFKTIWSLRPAADE
jgi:hypothetical protein